MQKLIMALICAGLLLGAPAAFAAKGGNGKGNSGGGDDTVIDDVVEDVGDTVDTVLSEIITTECGAGGGSEGDCDCIAESLAESLSEDDLDTYETMTEFNGSQTAFNNQFSEAFLLVAKEATQTAADACEIDYTN